ncbi:hypothetical protein Arub01_10790 [Actinomadura rubrobrunea]|uniref:Uncharacterized protein n=1 Tax=Actinomadura rubrobrunea TaxID=115335 RepID=A0A9W6PSJ6_9ACTN|nr:hypothetical protein [Actinomadura rubrobrunea]GLW62835.1 hypothetical protein Arub01_10790 [Actinomadura rubrobrunea]
MSGDLEPEEDGARRPDDRPAGERPGVERSGPEPGRPAFLPPLGGHPRLGEALVPPAQPLVPSAAPRASGAPPWAGPLWNAGVLVAAAVLLVSAFLPWVRARVLLSAFGQTLTRDLGTATGLDADGMAAAIPVLALAAFGMAFWGLIVDDPRVSSLTAVPGGMALVTSGVFLLRLDQTRDRLVGPDTTYGYEITPAYGWYMAVASSLLVLGFGLARPVVARASASEPAPQPAPPPPPQPQWHEAPRPVAEPSQPDGRPASAAAGQDGEAASPPPADAEPGRAAAPSDTAGAERDEADGSASGDDADGRDQDASARRGHRDDAAGPEKKRQASRRGSTSWSPP